jgi:hypothetical protein
MTGLLKHPGHPLGKYDASMPLQYAYCAACALQQHVYLHNVIRYIRNKHMPGPFRGPHLASFAEHNTVVTDNVQTCISYHGYRWPMFPKLEIEHQYCKV